MFSPRSSPRIERGEPLHRRASRCFAVEPICKVLDVSASAYYRRASGERSERVVEDERLLEAIREVDAAGPHPQVVK